RSRARLRPEVRLFRRQPRASAAQPTRGGSPARPAAALARAPLTGRLSYTLSAVDNVDKNTTIWSTAEGPRATSRRGTIHAHAAGTGLAQNKMWRRMCRFLGECDENFRDRRRRCIGTIHGGVERAGRRPAMA